MKYLILISIILIYGFQCYPKLKYDGSERYRLNGTVTDEYGMPLEDIPLVLYGAVLDGVEDNYDYYELSGLGVMSTKTGNNGQFEFVFSKSDAKGFTLYLNKYKFDNYSLDDFKGDQTYQETTVFFSPEAFSDYTLDLTAYMKLKKSTILTFECLENPVSDNYAIVLEKQNFINLDIEKDIWVTQNISIRCPEKDTIFLPVNDWIKFKVYTLTEMYNDSIFIGESPMIYTLK